MLNRILLGMVATTVLGSAQNPAEHVVFAPNNTLEVVWHDVAAERNSDKVVRVINMLDTADLRVIFSHATVPRYTGAVWSEDSVRCAVFDAPNNANTSLWIFVRKNSVWKKEDVDIFPIIEEHIPSSEIPDNPRGGIADIKWDTSTRLYINAIYDKKHYAIHVETNSAPFSVQVRKEH